MQEEVAKRLEAHLSRRKSRSWR